MILQTEKLEILSAIEALATREHNRGVESGFNLVRLAITWLKMDSDYTKVELAEMIEGRLREETDRAGLPR